MTFQEHFDLIRSSPAVIQEHSRRDRDYAELMSSCTTADARRHMERAKEEASTFFADTPQEWLSESIIIPDAKPVLIYNGENAKSVELIERLNQKG